MHEPHELGLSRSPIFCTTCIGHEDIARGGDGLVGRSCWLQLLVVCYNYTWDGIPDSNRGSTPQCQRFRPPHASIRTTHAPAANVLE